MQVHTASKKFIWLLLFVILTYWAFGMYYHLVFRYWWFDILTHTMGGAWAMFFAHRYLNDWFLSPSFLKNIILILGVVTLCGVLWEFGGFVLDRYIVKTGFTLLSGTYEDTLADLLWDMVGALSGYLLLYKYYD